VAINKLEKCQRRAARFVNGDYSRESSVTSMLKELKWPTLQQRRTNTKMVIVQTFFYFVYVGFGVRIPYGCSIF
jgi:hypothetical protein